MNSLNEKAGLFFSIVFTLHIGLALAVTFAPDFTKKKPKFENIYTVDLIQLSAPAPAPAPTPKIKAPAKTISKKAISTNTTKSDKIVPVSIKPKKKKIKKKKITPKKDNSAEQERIKKQQERLNRALAEEKRAQDLADEAQRILEEELRLLDGPITTDNRPVRQTPSNSRGTNSSGNSGALSVVEAQWLAKVNSHLLEYWSLPSLKEWDNSTRATIIVRIDSKGRILKDFFEKSSGDRIFDQFVKKSLQDASPLPAMPAAMKKKEFELGLKYTPNSIQ